jgi:hypothetical protein
MKLRSPSLPLVGIRVRPVLAFLLSLTLLSSFGLTSIAQQRVAVRAAPGGSESTPAPRSRRHEQAEEKGRPGPRRSRGTLHPSPPQKQQPVLTYTPVSADIETTGQPSFGAIGLQKTNAELMATQAAAPAVERGPRLMAEREYPDRRDLPQDPNSLPTANTPTSFSPEPAKPGKGRIKIANPKAIAIPRGPVPNSPQSISVPNFTGATLADTGAFPPDSMGAVGPTQFVVFLNGRVRTFNKATGVADGVLNVDSDVFFASVMTPLTGGVTVNFTSDPQIRYDRLSRRWIMAIIDVPGAASPGDLPNRVLIAISDAASSGVISGGTVWTYYFVQQNTVGGIPSTGEFLDYESLGVDNNALYIGGVMFGAASGSFIGCSLFVVQKNSILTGGPIVTTAFRGVVVGASDGPFAPRGVDNYDPTANEGYFIGVSNSVFGRLVLRRISNPGGVPTVSANILLTVSSTTFPENVPHLGNTGGTNGRLDAIDDRLFAAHIRNGRLWTAHNIEVNSSGVASNSGSRDAVRWYELNGIRSTDNGGTPVVVQSGTTFDPTAANPRYYWMPTVGISGQGHAAFGFSVAGNNDRANAGTNGRLRGDTLGTSGAVALYTASSTAYNPPGDPGPPRRWGDYSFVSLDPKDDMSMWTIQEFCNATNSYGVQVVRLLAPPPATPASAAATVPVGQSSVNVAITGTSLAGSEFYDPGADIAGAEPFSHISATVSGGVTVNSVTYTDPTHVTLNISTVGATVGSKDVTVTNPDGQSTTGVAILTVAPLTALIISEFRVRGSGGANDEFIEVYNASGSDHTVAGAGTGYAVAASDGVARCVIPNGTVIPNRGHYLCTNSLGYTLGAYATGDATYSTDIPDNAGIAIFNTSIPAGFNLPNRFDAVGSTAEANTVYKEGAGYPALTPFSIDYAFVRDECGKAGSIIQMGPCPTGGLPVDTDNNAADFVFVDPNGTSAGAGQRLGAGGPQNLSSPIQRNNVFGAPLLDATLGSAVAPNRVRDFTSDPASNSTFGTIEIRRRFVNNTGGSVTRLRFRVVDITTFAAPSGIADLRARTSALVVVNNINDAATCLASTGSATTPCSINVQGTTLEQPPSQLFGGAFNSTYSVGTITLGTPLANGASVNVRFLLGIQQTGAFKFYVNVEALP